MKRAFFVLLSILALEAWSRTGPSAPVGVQTLPDACGKNHYILTEPCETSVPGSWKRVADMQRPRLRHTATRLLDGRVLVAGGFSGQAKTTDTLEEHAAHILADAEIYDPVTNTWSATGAMHIRRQGHSAVLLPDGRVLVAGFSLPHITDAVEIYDPRSGTWRLTAPLSVPRVEMSLTLLANGKVLAAGGWSWRGQTLGGAEIFDPVTELWQPATSMVQPRIAHTATRMPDGKVLVVGGACDQYSRNALSAAETYDPLANRWAIVDSLALARQRHTTSLLADGRVLVTGGYAGSPPEPGSLCPTTMPEEDWETTFAEAEVLSTDGRWMTLPSLSVERQDHAAVTLGDGRVMIIGGGWLRPGSTEFFDESDATWKEGPAMTEPRSMHTATLLRDGRVLVTGGLMHSLPGVYSPNTASCEIFTP